MICLKNQNSKKLYLILKFGSRDPKSPLKVKWFLSKK